MTRYQWVAARRGPWLPEYRYLRDRQPGSIGLVPGPTAREEGHPELVAMIRAVQVQIDVSYIWGDRMIMKLANTKADT